MAKALAKDYQSNKDADCCEWHTGGFVCSWVREGARGWEMHGF
jgi:hypothetical protein